MDIKLSTYAVLDDREWLTPDGRSVKVCYSLRTARLIPLDPQVADHLRDGELDEISSADQRQLLDAEICVPSDQDELQSLLTRKRRASASLARRKFTLLPTAYCNMGCEYCGQTHHKTPVSGKHRDAVLRRIERAAAAASTEHVHITWFGGEPLMGFAVLRDIASRARKTCHDHGVRFTSTIVTNGALLDRRKLKSLAGECGVTHVEITLDGPADVHDVHRPLKSGGGSFERIVSTLQDALADPSFEGLRFGIRTNVDVKNEDRISELITLLADAGLAHPHVRMHLHPVHSWENEVEHLFVAKDRFAHREVDWLRQMRDRGIATKFLPSETADIVCGAVTRATEVDSPTGNVFSCTELPLVDEAEAHDSLARIEELDSNDLRPAGPFDDWHDSIARGEVPCTGCRLLPVCGGACPKAWRSGEYPCPSLKVNLEERMQIAVEANGLRLGPTRTLATASP